MRRRRSTTWQATCESRHDADELGHDTDHRRYPCPRDPRLPRPSHRRSGRHPRGRVAGPGERAVWRLGRLARGGRVARRGRAAASRPGGAACRRECRRPVGAGSDRAQRARPDWGRRPSGGGGRDTRAQPHGCQRAARRVPSNSPRRSHRLGPPALPAHRGPGGRQAAVDPAADGQHDQRRTPRGRPARHPGRAVHADLGALIRRGARRRPARSTRHWAIALRASASDASWPTRGVGPRPWFATRTRSPG